MLKKHLLVVFLLLLGGCVSGHGISSCGKGITVKTLRPPEINEAEKWGDISMVMVEVTTSPDITQAYNAIIKEKAKIVLADTPYLTIREMVDESAKKGVTEIEAAHHFLKFNVDLLDIQGSQNRVDIEIGMVAHLQKLRGDSYFECGVKDSVDHYTWQGDNLPPEDCMVREALGRCLASLIRQISPKEVCVYRPLKSGGNVCSRVANLLDSDNCDLARDLALEELASDPDNESLLYNLGVAYECLASKSHKQEKKVEFLEDAEEVYNKYLMLDAQDEDVQTARHEVKESLSIYQVARDKQSRAQSGLSDESTDGIKIY
ncbi:tetratricopeptide repeat protein [Desulfoplanes sp.]